MKENFLKKIEIGSYLLINNEVFELILKNRQDNSSYLALKSLKEPEKQPTYIGLLDLQHLNAKILPKTATIELLFG